jgi:hypothetical protein
MPLQRMVLEAKMRWRIQRDFQDLKQELGLGHYEGSWRHFPAALRAFIDCLQDRDLPKGRRVRPGIASSTAPASAP